MADGFEWFERAVRFDDDRVVCAHLLALRLCPLIEQEVVEAVRAVLVGQSMGHARGRLTLVLPSGQQHVVHVYGEVLVVGDSANDLIVVQVPVCMHHVFSTSMRECVRTWCGEHDAVLGSKVTPRRNL